jgi:hypothetical protein
MNQQGINMLRWELAHRWLRIVFVKDTRQRRSSNKSFQWTKTERQQTRTLTIGLRDTFRQDANRCSHMLKTGFMDEDR